MQSTMAGASASFSTRRPPATASSSGVPIFVYVGFHEYSPIDSSGSVCDLSNALSWYLGESFVSSCIALELVCTADHTCSLCNDRRGVSRDYVPPSNKMHSVVYLATRTEKGVIRLIDWTPPSDQYSFHAIPIDPQGFILIASFLQNQHNKGWNMRGVLFNFFLSTHFGCISGQNGEVAMKQRTWFCSELVTAALQRTGLVLDLVPCQTTPRQLYDRLQQDDVRKSAVYSDVKNKRPYRAENLVELHSSPSQLLPSTPFSSSPVPTAAATLRFMRDSGSSGTPVFDAVDEDFAV